MGSRLARSRTDRIIAGVCGGLGQYLGVDATLVRLVFLILAFGTGGGFFLYLILWLVMPREDWPEVSGEGQPAAPAAGEFANRAMAMGDEMRSLATSPNPRAGVFFGLALVGFGLLVLVQNLGLAWLAWLRWEVMWPVVLIVIGVLMIAQRIRRG
jgi:phage shock protein C